MKLNKILASLFVFPLCFSTLPTHAGDLDSPAEPSSAASAMYQLEDIYKRLDDGTAGSKRSGAFTEPASGPGSTGYTLDEVMGKAPQADNTNGVVPSEVLNSKTYWGLRTDGSWGLQTGTVSAGSNIGGANGSKIFTIPNGMYTGSKTATANDTDLSAGNIKGGVQIFGVTGTLEEASGNAVNGDVLNGKTYSNDSGSSTGSMASIGALSITPGISSQTITQGYHNGSGSVDGDSDLATSNIKNGVNIFGVAGSLTVASGDAGDGDVLNGKTYSNDSGSSTGSMANIGALSITPGISSQTITQGYHNGSGSVDGDSDLVTGNIKSGSNILGVAGDSNVVNTSTGDAVAGDILSGKKAWIDGSEVTGTALGGGASVPAPVEKTGQTLCYDPSGATANTVTCPGTGQDGETQIGTAWPNPRFTDNGDGTITDNLTDLIWLKNANCFGTRIWTTALSDANALANGSCNLTDSSSAGDWRLPNVKELSNAAGTARWKYENGFSNVRTTYYWSSSSYVGLRQYAWVVYLYNGTSNYYIKTIDNYVWPVRGGQ
jgi:hypothetical protein